VIGEQMNELPIEAFHHRRNAAMVLLVDDQAMIGEAVRRGLANEDNIDFHFCADPHQAMPRPCASSRR
jgi:two-component system chemotaxis family response regulator WspR